MEFAIAAFIAADLAAGATTLAVMNDLARFPPSGRLRLDAGLRGQEDADYTAIGDKLIQLASPTTQPHAARSCVSLLDEVA